MSSQAYTPGLKVKEYYIVSKTRRLPLLGKVLVKEGEGVSHNTIVARTTVPGSINVVNVCAKLGIEPDEVEKYMLIKVGDEIKKGAPLARFTALFGLLKETCYSPITGILELCSVVTGQAILRENPIPVDLYSYIPGIVEKVLPKEGVIIKTPATYIQGIFGMGEERSGEIKMVSKKPDGVVESDQIGSECKGKVIVCGSLIDIEGLKKGIEVGASGIVVGGIKGADLSALLGEEMGVIITGQENLGITLIVTEGFGKMSMQEKTFQLLKQNEGKLACINGRTQIRAGVIRPEIIIPFARAKSFKIENESTYIEGLKPGTLIRIIRDPYFGNIGKVMELPINLYRLESESEVRVLKAELVDGTQVIIPRANVEIIEE